MELGSVTLKRIGFFVFQLNTQHNERPESTCSKIMFSLFFLLICSFFNLYDKSLPENHTKRDEIDLCRTTSKVLVYVFCSKRIDFRAILRNTLGTLVESGLSPESTRVSAPGYKLLS